MHPNNGTVAKGKRSRQPLKHLSKTYANRMSLPTGNSPPYYPPLPIDTNTMDSSATAPPLPPVAPSVDVNSDTPPPAETSTEPFLGSVGPGVEYSHMQTYQHVGDKRIKTDHGYSISPSVSATPTSSQMATTLPYGDVHATTLYEESMASGEGEICGGGAIKHVNPECLALPEDKRHLTELHCFVRKHNVYLFCADASEVGVPKKGRKKALTLGQVGIGCTHCRYSEKKLKGCTYFPSSISGIYNATMIIQQRHFPVCPSVSKEIHSEYNKLKVLTARSASTKEYWIFAAKKMGLVDSSEGVFFHSQDMQQHAADNPSIQPPPVVSPEKLRSLVEPSDKIFATEYAYYVLSQMTMCHFTEADRLGKRKGHTVGFAGLACRHCYGSNGSGRFFPLTLKTFSDVSKSLHVLSKHLQKCPKCPLGMASNVSSLAELHEVEKQSQSFGSQKVFFDLIWRRLHPELYGLPSEDDHQSSLPLKSEEYQSPPDETKSTPPTEANDTSSAPTEKKRSALLYGDEKYPSSRECFIPKKRYCMQSSGAGSRTASIPTPATDRDPGLPPLYPTQRQSSSPIEFSETDVSVAMILATGFRSKKPSSPSSPLFSFLPAATQAGGNGPISFYLMKLKEEADKEYRDRAVAREEAAIAKAERNEDSPNKSTWGDISFLGKTDIAKLSNESLKRHLAARNEPIEGSKKKLIERLVTSVKEEKQREINIAKELEHCRIRDIEEKGSVYSVGMNGEGQLGVGDLDDRSVFTVVPALRGKQVMHLSSYGNVSCCLTPNSEVYTWGGNGVNPVVPVPETTTGFNSPQKMTKLDGEESVMTAVGSTHACSISKSGDLFLFGKFQLGTDDTKEKESPEYIDKFTARSVACGAKHIVVLTDEGEVYGWGSNVGSIEQSFQSIPMHVKIPEAIKLISCGTSHTLAASVMSRVYSWGCGDGYRLGHGDCKDLCSPCEISALGGEGSRILDISAGVWHSACVVDESSSTASESGCLYTWGSGCFSQLGLGSNCIAPTPTKVDGLSKVKRIFCGRTHNAAITHDDNLYTWGSNSKGQLGRKIQETGVTFTPYPGSVDEFGTMVNRIGRGKPASVTCGDDFTLVATYPYTGPSEKEMLELVEMKRRKEQEEKEEQARIQREQEEEEKRQREIQEEKEKIYYLTSKRLCTLDESCPGFTYDSSKPSICKECGYSVSFHTILADDEHEHKGPARQARRGRKSR